MKIPSLNFTKLTAEAYFQWIIVSLGLLFLVFDTSLATIYWILIGGDFIFYYFNYREDKVIQFPIERRTDNRLKSLISALVAYAVFLLVSTLLVRTISPMAISEGGLLSILKLMASSVPIFSGSIILSEYAFGIMVPAVESSLFFGRILEKMVSVFSKRSGQRVTWDKFNIPMMMSIIFCTGLFIIYHLQSKGIENVPLLITGIFGFVSCILVIKDQELKSAILLHVISNSMVILSSFNII